MQKRIILGSASPRRRELLEQIGISFEVKVSDREEIYTAKEPEEIVKELACEKANHVAEDMKDSGEARRNLVIIGADTVVVLDGKILGKPKKEEEAFQMLTALQGRSHQVYTGVAMLYYDEEEKCRKISEAKRTEVYVHAMTETEIRRYIATGEPMDKAGSYGIQGKFAPFIDRIEGDYYNVVGLPVAYVYQTFKELGIFGQADVSEKR